MKRYLARKVITCDGVKGPCYIVVDNACRLVDFFPFEQELADTTYLSQPVILLSALPENITSFSQDDLPLTSSKFTGDIFPVIVTDGGLQPLSYVSQ